MSAVSLGTWPFAGDTTWGEQQEDDSIGCVHAALDNGINFFDTAPLYGQGSAEQVPGKALKGRRHQAVIATKAGPEDLRGSRLRESCERSLRFMKTDYLDLYQVHWPSREVPLGETIEALEKLEKEGKVRASGICRP